MLFRSSAGAAVCERVVCGLAREDGTDAGAVGDQGCPGRRSCASLSFSCFGDCSTDPVFTSQLSPSLNNAPHNGNLDHALSFCTSLRELVVQFQYTGAALLDSLRASPSLESLFFLGPPTGTGAAELARRIEGGDQFARLQRVIVSGQFGGRGVLGGGGWLGADVRRLKSVCAEAKVYCLVASS